MDDFQRRLLFWREALKDSENDMLRESVERIAREELETWHQGEQGGRLPASYPPIHGGKNDAHGMGCSRPDPLQPRFG